MICIKEKTDFMSTMMNTKCKNNITINQIVSLQEYRNSIIEVYCVKPHARYQSNRVQINSDCKYSSNISTSSNVWQFLYFHTIHMMHASTRFHTSEECLPNQFLQPNKRDSTVNGITKWTWNALKTSLHKA